MRPIQLTKIHIDHVRHLRDLDINLSEGKQAPAQNHFLLTGRNGSGKTNLLLALWECLQAAAEGRARMIPEEGDRFTLSGAGLTLTLRSVPVAGDGLLAFFPADRALHGDALQSGQTAAAQPLLECLQSALRTFCVDSSLTLDLDPESRQILLCSADRDPVPLEEHSSGLSSFLAIVIDLSLRLQEQNGTVDSDRPGLVLIDEPEAHLSLQEQRRLLPCLRDLFPGLSFIAATNSPFILQSAGLTSALDLDTGTLIHYDFSQLSCSGIVEAYFHRTEQSEFLQQKLVRYEELVQKDHLTDREYRELPILSLFLEKSPDFLLPESSRTRYLQLQNVLHHRQDL